jgi:hypothetical protein
VILRAVLVSLLTVASAQAQPFIELGAGGVTGGCIPASGKPNPDHRYGRELCSPAPLGLASVGWQLPNGLSVQWEHWSSIATKHDRGLEIVSVRWRYTWGRAP